MSKILIIEDEEAIADLEKDYLELSGFEVEIANRGDVGLEKALNEDYDLIILDLMLPEVDGFDICRQVRQEKNIPIIMVSAKKDDIDKIRGLGLGADDYMTKPFSPSELVARVKAHMERYNRLVGSSVVKNDIIEIRGIKIDKTARRIWVNGEEKTEEEILSQVKEELESLRMFCQIGEGSITVDETEDIDWINNWKKYFKQFYVDDILIIPSWEEVKEEDKDKMIIHIDPGTAFGTGMHETTQLCIRQLKKYVTSETELLDVGTGSGILSIIALKMGAKHAVGTDLDPCAVPAVEENKEVNGIVPESFDMMIGNIIDDKEVQDKVGYECYDIVVANILADVLVPLTPVIVNQMKSGAVYITSGIIDDKEQTVVDAVKAAGLEILEVTYQGEWVSVTARKQA